MHESSVNRRDRGAGAQAPALLLTGFEPFGGRARNRAWEVASGVAEHCSLPLHVEQLPVDYAALPARLDALLARELPLLMLGEAERPEVEVERVGLNLVDDIEDNRGDRHSSDRVVARPEAPLALETRLDTRALVEVISAAGVAAGRSTSAGTYLCNFALYHALHARSAGGPPVGFIHLPRNPDFAPLLSLRRAIAAACERVTSSG